MRKKAIIYGATVTAAAIASVLKSDCIVINNGYNCAFEVADSYRTAKISDSAGYSHETKQFTENLKSRNILRNGYIHPLPFAGLIALYFRLYNTRIYFSGTLEKVSCSSEKADVTFFTNGEKVSVSADIFIDTTDYGRFDRFLCAALVPNCPNPAAHRFSDMIKRGAVEDEYYLQVNSNNCKTYSEAFMNLQKFWVENHKDAFSDFSVVSVANELMTVYEKPVFEKQNNIIHIPSASFGTPADSFEGGLQCLRNIQLH